MQGQKPYWVPGLMLPRPTHLIRSRRLWASVFPLETDRRQEAQACLCHRIVARIKIGECKELWRAGQTLFIMLTTESPFWESSIYSGSVSIDHAEAAKVMGEEGSILWQLLWAARHSWPSCTCLGHIHPLLHVCHPRIPQQVCATHGTLPTRLFSSVSLMGEAGCKHHFPHSHNPLFLPKFCQWTSFPAIYSKNRRQLP